MAPIRPISFLSGASQFLERRDHDPEWGIESSLSAIQPGTCEYPCKRAPRSDPMGRWRPAVGELRIADSSQIAIVATPIEVESLESSTPSLLQETTISIKVTSSHYWRPEFFLSRVLGSSRKLCISYLNFSDTTRVVVSLLLYFSSLCHGLGGHKGHCCASVLQDGLGRIALHRLWEFRVRVRNRPSIARRGGIKGIRPSVLSG
jgi:hypothetical protein